MGNKELQAIIRHYLLHSEKAEDYRRFGNHDNLAGGLAKSIKKQISSIFINETMSELRSSNNRLRSIIASGLLAPTDDRYISIKKQIDYNDKLLKTADDLMK
jgi:hypothetical protein